jgi:hypothetical protein
MNEIELVALEKGILNVLADCGIATKVEILEMLVHNRVPLDVVAFRRSSDSWSWKPRFR